MISRRDALRFFGAGTLGSFARISVRPPPAPGADAALRVAAERAARGALLHCDDAALAGLLREQIRRSLAELGMTLGELVRTMAHETSDLPDAQIEQIVRSMAALIEDDATLAAGARLVLGGAQPAADTPDPRDAVGLPCASCGRLLTRADASYERQQRHDLRYPAVGRWLAWTDAGWLCARCAYPPRVRRAVQFVPGIANRWIVDVDGWLVEKRRGTLPGVELGEGVQ